MAEHFNYRDAVEPGAMVMLAGIAGTLARWRNWHNPDDMKLPDGSPHPRAGKISRVKVAGDLGFVPGLTFILFGVARFAAWRWGWPVDPAVLAAASALCAMLGSSFFLNAFEKIRDAAIEAAARRLGGK